MTPKRTKVPSKAVTAEWGGLLNQRPLVPTKIKTADWAAALIVFGVSVKDNALKAQVIWIKGITLQYERKYVTHFLHFSRVFEERGLLCVVGGNWSSWRTCYIYCYPKLQKGKGQQYSFTTAGDLALSTIQFYYYSIYSISDIIYQAQLEILSLNAVNRQTY